MIWLAMGYLLFKLAEISLTGELPALLALDSMSWLMLLELAVGAIIPITLWFAPASRAHPAAQWGLPVLVLAGVLLNRFNATMFAQLLRPEVTYSPHVLEWLSTVGILAGVALVWYLGVRLLAMSDE
jgi:Ni/Fe-hydrogenase subunit HybB-like protein